LCVTSGAPIRGNAPGIGPEAGAVQFSEGLPEFSAAANRSERDLDKPGTAATHQAQQGGGDDVIIRDRSRS
jgi:hypothetical protein